MKKRLRRLLTEIKEELSVYNGKFAGDTEGDENPVQMHFEYTIKRIEEELGEDKKWVLFFISYAIIPNVLQQRR